MPNRLLFSIRHFSKVFSKMLKFSLMLTILLTLIRFNLFFLSVSAWLRNSSFSEVFLTIITGFRFDLVCMGFVLLPLLVFWLCITLFVRWNRITQFLSLLWFKLAWTLMIVIQIFDFLSFHKTGLRIREQQLANIFDGWLEQAWIDVPLGPFIVFILVVLIIWSLGLWILEQIQLGDWKNEYSPIPGSLFEYTWRILLPLIVVFAMARGTVEEEPLRYEHSLISDETRLNEMALNPMWTLIN
jgi:hypothetical protein